MLRCTACGSSICGVPCAEKWWKRHRPECRRLQAVAFGEEYAREEDRSYRFTRFSMRGDVREMKRLTIGLSVAVARTKFVKSADEAMRAFVDFVDPRDIAGAVYGAAQVNRPEVVRLLHVTQPMRAQTTACDF